MNSPMTRVAIGSDHGGFQLKEAIKKAMEDRHISFKDFGTHSTDSMDYPDTAVPVARDVAENRSELGILICRTGIGMSITANKIQGVRAALCNSPEHARLSRLHNNANVLTLAGDTDPSKAWEIVDTFLNTRFENEMRHKKRIDKIHSLTGM